MLTPGTRAPEGPPAFRAISVHHLCSPLRAHEALVRRPFLLIPSIVAAGSPGLLRVSKRAAERRGLGRCGWITQLPSRHALAALSLLSRPQGQGGAFVNHGPLKGLPVPRPPTRPRGDHWELCALWARITARAVTRRTRYWLRAHLARAPAPSRPRKHGSTTGAAGTTLTSHGEDLLLTASNPSGCFASSLICVRDRRGV
ncbi:hypothetical protein C8Q78DRAFT_1005902 [Trametes maxima]|nr:hypothetical protein C8Q78DRAFT_1005902 [Trametes maxima]